MGAVHRLALDGTARPSSPSATRAGDGDGERTWRGVPRRPRRARDGASRADRAAGADERGRSLRRPAAGLPRGRPPRPACRCACSRSAPPPASTCAGTPTATRPPGFAWGPPASPLRSSSRSTAGRCPTRPAAVVAERRGCDAAPIDPATEEGAAHPALLCLARPGGEAGAAARRARARRRGAGRRSSAAAAAELDSPRGSAEPSPGVRDRRLPLGRHAVPDDGRTRGVRGGDRRRPARAASAEAPLAWLRMEPAGDRVPTCG